MNSKCKPIIVLSILSGTHVYTSNLKSLVGGRDSSKQIFLCENIILIFYL